MAIGGTRRERCLEQNTKCPELAPARFADLTDPAAVEAVAPKHAGTVVVERNRALGLEIELQYKPMVGILQTIGLHIR